MREPAPQALRLRKTIFVYLLLSFTSAGVAIGQKLPAFADTASAVAAQKQFAGVRITGSQESVGPPAANNPRSAAVQGVVTGIDGKPIDSARIIAVSADERERHVVALADVQGRFNLTGLEPGNWNLTISANDMLSEMSSIALVPGETKSIEASLDAAEGADLLRITGKRTLIHPDNIGSTTHVDQKLMQEYKTYNNTQDLVKTTPGVLSDTLGNIIVRGEHNAINYMMDGVVLPEAAGVLQQAQFTTPRALQSMDVNIGGYEAQDGGGPLGAVVHMKSAAIQTKPTFQLGGQFGWPLAGNLNYYASTAFSRNPNSRWYRLRAESIGAVTPTAYGLAPPGGKYSNNSRIDMNFLTKIEYLAGEHDRIKCTIGINHSLMQVPQIPDTAHLGYKVNQTDIQDYCILSWNHKHEQWFDESHLHMINAWYLERATSTNVFNPWPIINGDGNVWSVSPYATRKDYVFGLQGDVSKTLFKTHHLLAGFLTEFRPTRTKLNEWVYDATPGAPTFGALISPFTGVPGGPYFQGNMGNQHQFRWLQCAYFQDTWKPTTGILRRMTFNAGVRFDLYHGVFGNTLPIAQTVATIPGAGPFILNPFTTQRVTNAQASGRFGGSFVITKNTVLRGSFDNLFMPPPVDAFVQPFLALDPTGASTTVQGIFPGSFRRLVATRGQLVDTSVEQQLGPRFVWRNNLFYKKLKNFGDSGVIDNTTVYNRLNLSNQEAYGVETRFDLKPNREGCGFNGFLSNTIQAAYLRGSKKNTGGIWDPSLTPVLLRFPDHDRRYTLNTGFGWRGRNHLWWLAEAFVQTGVKNEVDQMVFGPQPARVPPATVLGFNAGYVTPKLMLDKHHWLPADITVRVLNMTNQRYPLNLGSPYQGTRYQLPLRLLVEANWNII